MSLIKPFAGLRPVAGRAADVAAPPYDVLNTEEARARASGRPWSFLHISKPEIDLPAGTSATDPAVYARGRANLDRMLAEGILVRDSSPRYYVYRLVMGAHRQTGLVAVASVADYDVNRIRKHEYTRPDKEDDRVRQIDALNAQTGPVFITYRQSAAINAIVDTVTTSPPEVDIIADDGVGHTLWPVADAAAIDGITRGFDAMDALYIADGHHRSAAASRVAAMRRGAGTVDPSCSYEYFLSVLFPDNQMQILDYNRVIRDLNGLDSAGLLAALEPVCRIAPSDGPARPECPAQFGMYLDGRWYRLDLRPERIPADDPVRRLDVSLLADNIIEPLLGISDPRRDPRIDFVGGIRPGRVGETRGFG